jgi:hypothetical protein
MGDFIEPRQGYTRAGNPMAIAGFACALGGIIPFIGVLAAICGIVFSAIGLKRSSTVGNGRGLSIAGLIIGILLSIPGLIVMLSNLNR